MPKPKTPNIPEIVSDSSHYATSQPIFSLKPGGGTEGFDFLSTGVSHDMEPMAHLDDKLVENVGSATRKSLSNRAANRNLGQARELIDYLDEIALNKSFPGRASALEVIDAQEARAKSKIAQSEMGNVPRQSMAEELSKGDPRLAAELEEGFQRTAEKMRGPERRVTEGSAPGGTERRINSRRQSIDEIKRLKGELSADAARQANPAGRDTLVRNVPKIKERIAGTRQKLIETAPGPSTIGTGKLAGKLAGKALGAAGMALNAVEHWRATNAVNTEENKDAPWMDKFAAYSERVLGMPTGSSGRSMLPSEDRAARSL